MTSYGTFKASNFRYLTGQMLDAGAVPSSFLGGTVNQMIAGGALNFGDVVQVTATTAVQVNKATTALYLTIGVVVGGTVTNNEILTDSTLVGTASGQCAAAQGASVMVQRSGVVQVLTDTSAIVVGSLLSPSAATSGSAALGSTAGFTAATGAQTSVTTGIVGSVPLVPNIGFAQTLNGSAAVVIVAYLKGLI